MSIFMTFDWYTLTAFKSLGNTYLTLVTQGENPVGIQNRYVIKCVAKNTQTEPHCM